MKNLKTLIITLFIIALNTQVWAKSSVKEIHVDKSERKLELIGFDNQVLKTYKVMLGRTPIGAKTEEGDNKTPEGTYTLDLKNPASKFHKAFHISYPNARDTLNARLHRKDPGGEIMLHGLPNNFVEMRDWLASVNLDDMADDVVRAALVNYDWTNGCIAVTNAEIEEIYNLVDVPTKIIINP